jgi:glycosyltransferase involved in cell wall biosynthesis
MTQISDDDLAYPRAAVVVTCHDDAATLGETIASIRSQHPPVELVVVDDGSSDPATLRLLAELQQDGVSVVHQVNQGQAAAAMTGLHATSAPYVMRFDSDDMLVPGAVAALADALDGAQEAAAAWGDVHTFGLTNVRIPSAPSLDPWLVTYTNCLPAGGTLFRRTALSESGGWQLPAGFEDWDLWMALAERGNFGVYVPAVIYRYRRNTSGRLAGWLPETSRYYEELRLRHPSLFAMRDQNRRRSPAPVALKIAISAVDGMPWLRRLTRIQLSELFTRLLWNGGIRNTAKMVVQAIAIRTGRR